MKAIVISIKDSASGKSEVISIQGTADTVFGTSQSVIYSHAVAKGTCKVIEGQELDLNMDSFVIETSELTYADGSVHSSYWLKLRG